MDGDDLDGRRERLRARVEEERHRVEELNREAAVRRAAARAMREQVAAAVDAVIARQQARGSSRRAQSAVGDPEPG